MFDTYLSRWRLAPDGAAIHTHSSDLLPVRRDGAPLMLKIAREPESASRRPDGVVERRSVPRAWWSMTTARCCSNAHTGPQSLAAMAKDGRDDEATRIICAAAARLHAPRAAPLPASCR